LNWKITAAWRPYFLDLQVAGYVEERDGMTFTTVHGAGHMVPQDKRPEAFYMISNWIKNIAL
jgi:carboxypeptidase C (cathepsin A)